jgi:hypothetical protein
MGLKTKTPGGALALNANGKLTCACCDPCIEFNASETLDVVVSGWPGESCCIVLGSGTEEDPYSSYKTVGDLGGSYTLENDHGFGFYSDPINFEYQYFHDENCETSWYDEIFDGVIIVQCYDGSVYISAADASTTLPLATFLSSGATIPYPGCPGISITITVA